MPAYWLGSSMYNYICIELEYNNNNRKSLIILKIQNTKHRFFVSAFLLSLLVNLVNLTFQLLLAHFLLDNKENCLNMSLNMNYGLQEFAILDIIFHKPLLLKSCMY